MLALRADRLTQAGEVALCSCNAYLFAVKHLFCVPDLSGTADVAARGQLARSLQLLFSLLNARGSLKRRSYSAAGGFCERR